MANLIRFSISLMLYCFAVEASGNSQEESFLSKFPTIKLLHDNLKLRPMNGVDVPLVEKFIPQFFSEFNPSMIQEVSRVPGLFDRFIFYSDEFLEVRIHKFHKGATDDTSHDHQRGFMSSCLYGSYMHHIVSIMEGGEYYQFKRRSGGIYAEPEKKQGVPDSILTQPFEAGQTLYLSPMAFHMVEISPDVEVVTITFRDISHKVKAESTFQSINEHANIGKEKVEVLTADERIKEIKKLQEILAKINEPSISEPDKPKIRDGEKELGRFGRKFDKMIKKTEKQWEKIEQEVNIFADKVEMKTEKLVENMKNEGKKAERKIKKTFEKMV